MKNKSFMKSLKKMSNCKRKLDVEKMTGNVKIKQKKRQRKRHIKLRKKLGKKMPNKPIKENKTKEIPMEISIRI